MKKRYITAGILLLAALTVSLCAFSQRSQQLLSQKLIRLHVVANSDAPGDQAVKLLVRDAVLREAAIALKDAADPEASLQAALPALTRAANETLFSQGSLDAASVSLRRELFPTREYDTFRLPAGVYKSLRVTIGKGEGHNWWCVVFPALCLPASSEELTQACLAAGLTEGEVSILTGDTEEIELEFKTLELLAKLKKLLWDA